MKKRNVLVLVLGLVIALPASAQWDRWHTSTAISGVLGVASQAIQSAERKRSCGFTNGNQTLASQFSSESRGAIC